ncbi:hypothetical protein GJ496_005549 [Pomphorhynchus laevis]|nr:hypothetical protein GJ496_005549 [Pomphorhynchus laevis]
MKRNAETSKIDLGKGLALILLVLLINSVIRSVTEKTVCGDSITNFFRDVLLRLFDNQLRGLVQSPTMEELGGKYVDGQHIRFTLGSCDNLSKIDAKRHIVVKQCCCILGKSHSP